MQSAAFSNVLLKARVIQLAPAMIAGWQMIFGAVPLLVTGFIVEGNPLRFHWSGLSIFCLLYLAVIGSALTFLLLYWLLPRMTVANLQATIPIFGMVFAHLMLPDEPLRLRRLAGALLALGGVTIICERLLGFNGWMAFWGGLGIVFGAAGAAFSNVLLKARVIQLAPAMIAGWQMVFGAVPLLVTGFVVEGNPLRFHWSGLSIFCLFYLAVIGSALTFLLLYWLLHRMTVANLQAISLVTPPGAVALGWAIGGEKFSLWSLVGACFVLAGVWMIFRKTKVRDLAIQEG